MIVQGFVMLVSLALAGGPTLILVGDTGEDTPMARAVSAAVNAELEDPDAWVLALGDLYYDAPPIALGEGCADAVAERYRAFYGPFPDKVYAVVGNHDLMASDDDVYSPEARACTEAAFAKLGWGSPASRLQTLDQGRARVDLVLLDAGYYGVGVSPPTDLPLRDNAHWRFYAAHYTWRSAHGKCGEANKIPETWLGAPPMDLWLNGHAHHLEANPIDARVAITSGGGFELRPSRPCEGIPSLFAYTGAPGARRGGYVRLEVKSKKKLRLTPVLCEASGDAAAVCTDQPTFVCTKDRSGPGGRGVSCVADGSD